MEDLSYLVNKPPIEEITNIDLVNKPPIESDAIIHYGVLGMKWGVRRYQNKNGSLTPLGKKHLQLLEATNPKKAEKFKKAVLKSSEKIEAHNEKVRNKNLKKARKAKAKISANNVNDAIKNADSQKLSDKERKNLEKIKKDPKKFAKNLNKFSPDEVNDAIRNFNMQNQLSNISTQKIQNGVNKVNTILQYGNTLNNALNFINSDVGRGIRKAMGINSDKLFDFSKESPLGKLKAQAETTQAQANISRNKLQTARNQEELRLFNYNLEKNPDIAARYQRSQSSGGKGKGLDQDQFNDLMKNALTNNDIIDILKNL